MSMMFTWLFKKKPSLQVTLPTDKAADVSSGFFKPMTASELLAPPRRQKLLAHIWQRTSISRTQFKQLYLTPIECYAELVQQFPASESHHHAYPGGMLDHGLEIMAYALKLRQSYLLPIGTTPEDQAAHAEAWSACAAYAALLHDIGKIAVDIEVEYENGKTWHPWHGIIRQPYRFQYKTNRQYRLHSASTGLLYTQVLNKTLLDWLSQTPDLWAALLYVLAGQFEQAGILGEIVIKADQASVAQELGGDPAKAMTAPKQSLQRKLLEGLRYLIKEELKLNNTGPSDGWLTEDALWLVSKTVADKLRAYLLSQGISGIPSKNSEIFNVMQEHGLVLATVDDKAIWNATVTSTTGWGTTFTFLKVSPALIWAVNDRPEAFTGSVVIEASKSTEKETAQPKEATTILTNDVVAPKPADSLDNVFDLLGFETLDVEESNELTAIPSAPLSPVIKTRLSITPKELVNTAATESPPIVLKTATSSSITLSAEHFMQWLKEAILGRKLIINDAKALVHTVDNTLFIVTPGIFNRYVQEFPQVQTYAKAENIPEWRWVQKQFEKLKSHRKHLDGLNIWTCEVKGPHNTKQVHGYLLEQPELILPDIPFNNPYLKVLDLRD